MNISRHNYEEFFILYMDNELNTEERQAVDAFVAANPDLKAELELLSQTKFADEEVVFFNDKSSLLRSSSTKTIHSGNTSDWLLLYVDHELNADDMKKADEVLSVQPEIRKELDLLLKTKSSPDTAVVYPNKAELFRKEEAPVIGISWRRIAVAAIFIITAGSAAYLSLSTNDDEIIPTKNPVAEQKVAPVTVIPSKEIKETTENISPVITGNETDLLKTETVDQPKEATHQSSKATMNNNVVTKVADDRKAIPTQETKSTVVNESPKSNELPKATTNPGLNTSSSTQVGTVANNDNKNPVLTSPKENNSLQSVTQDTPQALYTSNGTSSSNEEIDANDSGKKNKFRGFFRKVTRTIEKNTRIKATDDEDRLLIGAVAIKL